FVPLMAMCLWAIAHLLSDSEIGPNAPVNPYWATFLVQQGVHPGWVENLQRSDVGNFSIKRVGTIIIPTKWNWPHHIEILIRAAVPFGISGGKTGTTLVEDCMVPHWLFPTDAQRRSAVRFDPMQPTFSLASGPAPPFVPPPVFPPALQS